MIVAILFMIVNFLIKILIFFLPSWNLPAEPFNYLAQGYYTIIQFSDIFPVQTFFIVLSLILTFELFMILARFGAGIISIIRGGGKIDI